MASTLITAYLGQGLAAARPAAPTLATGTYGTYYATDTRVWSAYFNGVWQNIGTGIDLFAPPLASAFPTIINGGTASPAPSVTDTAYGMLFDSGATTASDVIRAALQPIPNATTFTVVMGVRFTMAQINYRSLGLFITDGTKFTGIHLQSNILQVTRYTNLTTYSANQAQLSNQNFNQCYYKIVGDGTNLKFSFSFDGRNFVQIYSETLASFMSTITKIGVGSDANASATPPAAGDHIFADVFYWAASTP